MKKQNLFTIFGTIVLVMIMFGCPNEQSINQVGAAESSDSQTAYLTIGVNESSRTALPTVNDVTSFDRFVLTGRASDNDIAVSVDLTWDGDGTTDAYTKLTTANIAVTAGASYSFTLTAFKSGASWSDTKELTVAIGTANNHISFNLSFAAPSANSNGTGSISVTLTVPNKVVDVDAVLKNSVGTPMPSAGLQFNNKKATYDASNIPSGNYVLTFILWGDTDKKLKLGEWREYVCVAKDLTSISLPSIDNSADLDSIYTITFDLNGGTLTGTFAGSYTRHSDVALPTAANISRTGYTFDGWWKVVNDDTTADTTTDIWNKDKNQTGNVTFKAGWTPKWYIDSTGNFVYGDRVFQKTGLKKVMESNAEIYGSGSDGVFVTNRKVTLSPYSIGKYEVTQELYEAVMGYNNSAFKETPTLQSEETNISLRPVECINWYQAITFCNKLSLLMGKEPCYTVENVNWATITYNDIPHLVNGGASGDTSAWDAASCDFTQNGYRLPIECEWEFAARGGNPSDSTNWNCTYSDSDILNSVAWCNHNGHTREVGLKTANGCGICDMIGNVWEWCWDYYSESISSNMPLTGPAGSTHSLRGECWYATPETVTLFSKTTIASHEDNNSCVGFRIACTEGTWASSSEQVSNYVATGSGNFVINGVECLKTGMVTVLREAATINATVTDSPVFTGSSVSLPSYSISRYEVTREFYHAVMGGTAPSEGEKLLPINTTWWNDAVDFCNALSSLMGKTPYYNANRTIADSTANGYRLPTSAEWEFAARGGDPSAEAWNYKYSGTNDINQLVNYAVYSTSTIAEVGSKLPNTLGLYDMSGNVFDWCQEQIGDQPYYRLVRGGYCTFGAPDVGINWHGFSNTQYDNNGFYETRSGIRIVCNGVVD